MERILVLGAKGMLGRDLVPLLQSSLKVDVVDWDIEEINIEDETSTVPAIENLKPGVIINAAAYTDVDGCESHREKAFAVNAEGMRHVTLGAQRCGARVVYLSTDYVFDGGKGAPYVEEDLARPLNVYGQSKWKGEEYVRQLSKDFLIVRTQWLYGRHGKNFVDTILRLAREKKVLTIVDDQVGSPTYTVDLAKALAELVRQEARGVFNVVNKGSCSWFEFAKEIVRQSGLAGVEVLPISSKELNRPAVRPAYSVLSTEKLARETGITLRPWQEAVVAYLESVRS